MKKNEEKALRVKYIRNLEKFFNGAVLALKKENFDKAKFEERVLKNTKLFKKNSSINLNSAYTKNLELFVNACLDFSKEKSELINLANALDKQKKQSWKKEKYKNCLKDYK